MKKLIVILSLIGILFSPIVTAVVYTSRMTKSEKLDYLIRKGYHRTASKIMSQEIIKQLKEKEDMTVREYLIKQYYKELLREIGEIIK